MKYAHPTRLNREPVIGKHTVLIGGLGADGEDAAVHTHIPYLHLVGNSQPENPSVRGSLRLQRAKPPSDR